MKKRTARGTRLGNVGLWVLLASMWTIPALTLARHVPGSSGDESLVRSAFALSHLEASIRDVRFRTAGVLLQEFCPEASAGSLEETRHRILVQWSGIKDDVREGWPEPAIVRLIDSIDTGMIAFGVLADTLEHAYMCGDDGAIRRCFVEDWPSVYMHLVKPIMLLRERVEDQCLRRMVSRPGSLGITGK